LPAEVELIHPLGLLAEVGRLDLLEPLSVYSLHGSMSGDYGGTISSQESLRSE
jgi:hypothetical protein